MTVLLPERLQTQRLILRKPRPADASLIFQAYAQDREVVRHLIWQPHQNMGETESFIAYCMQAWADGHSRPYLLAHRDEQDTPIGMLEARINSHTVDIGYVLQRSDWGGGLMPEAVDAVRDAALSHPACFRIQALCDAENHASARVLEKCGFVREGQLGRHAVFPNIAPEPRASLMYARCR